MRVLRVFTVPFAVGLAALAAHGASAAVTPGWECIPTAAGQAVVSGGTGATPSCGPSTTAVLAPTYVSSGVGGKPTVEFSALNVQIVSGSGSTGASPNGLGNLVIGYAENPAGRKQSGSNDLIVGSQNGWSGYGEIVGGLNNMVSGPWAVAFGRGNTASGVFSAALGGRGNVASADSSSVAGGEYNRVTDPFASILGGCSNLAGAGTLSVSSSCTALAASLMAIGGGIGNQDTSLGSAILGGDSNSVVGGQGDAIAGGNHETLSGSGADISRIGSASFNP
jgi:hypothetical protein